MVQTRDWQGLGERSPRRAQPEFAFGFQVKHHLRRGARSYPFDDMSSTFTCTNTTSASATDYNVGFSDLK